MRLPGASNREVFLSSELEATSVCVGWGVGVKIKQGNKARYLERMIVLSMASQNGVPGERWPRIFASGGVQEGSCHATHTFSPDTTCLITISVHLSPSAHPLPPDAIANCQPEEKKKEVIKALHRGLGEATR
ncbi:hypothetical protein Btru_001116 [Bulinus truncatus]|nr:hypothetical protein Btru_001116 [Bulinus truncatus]